MKKNKIRLTLSRETLRSLASDQLSGAQGGALEPVTYDSARGSYQHLLLSS